jgi:leukemia factor-related protein
VWILTPQFYVAGKAANKEGGPEEKKDDGELWCNVEAQAAFLGPNLWDKTLPYDADLKVRIHSPVYFIC